MFVQVIQGSVADADELRASLDRWNRDLGPGAVGWLGATSGVTADGRAIAMVRFESADAARANSERPEQHQWWMETSKLFAGDVTFHDSRQVYEFGAGGSDDAGFVQVIQGRVTDPDRALELMRQTEEPMRELRPDVIGGVIAVHGDDGFTQAVYFTSQEAAREGERKTAPPEAQKAMEEQMALMADLVYFDLTNPWLDSPA
jgi:hypothetical protein